MKIEMVLLVCLFFGFAMFAVGYLHGVTVGEKKVDLILGRLKQKENNGR